MSDKKAPSFDEVAARLDKMIATALTVPSVRDLRDACGGIGSLSTYQGYLNRWMEQRGNIAGVASVVLAIEAERRSHASMMSLLLARLEQHSRVFPPFDVSDGDNHDEVQSAGVSDARDAVGEDEFARREESAIASRLQEEDTARLAAQSVARFTHDEPAAQQGEPVSRPAAYHEQAAPARSASMPTASDFPKHQTSSLSRSDGGGQQAAYPLGTNRPAPGESDTAGGSRHGNA